jgi:hypothetical protein
VSVFFRNTSLGKCADDAASGRTGGCTNRGCRQPTGRNDRSETGDREQAQSREKASCAADTRTDACTLSGTFGSVIDSIAVPINFFIGAEPAIRVIGDDADLGVRHTRCFEALNCGLSVGVGVVETRNSNSHIESFRHFAVFTLP